MGFEGGNNITNNGTCEKKRMNGNCFRELLLIGDNIAWLWILETRLSFTMVGVVVSHLEFCECVGKLYTLVSGDHSEPSAGGY